MSCKGNAPPSTIPLPIGAVLIKFNLKVAYKGGPPGKYVPMYGPFVNELSGGLALLTDTGNT